MKDKKEVCITVTNLDKCSYVQKYINCDKCHDAGTCVNMADCPVVGHISHDVLRTTYRVDASKLYIDTATYGLDFRRALDVVNMAIDTRRRKR